ncbi:MAG: group II intron reverse transcriptase/maturase [Acidobacteria bacterium]|nr:group II intron reverse transcriptase/maturase [Acidobacteriota bacterium]
MSLQTPDSVRRLQRALYVKAKNEPAYRFYLLYDKVCRDDVLTHAYRVSRAARGARTPGVDGVTFAAIEASGREAWLVGLKRALQDKTYRPDAVRRVLIPKPDGGERPLGIPTIRDRVVQTAVKLVLEPIFEADFDDSAYGYRPKRSAQDAVRVVHDALCDGYTEVVDADLSKYFDTIPHQELLQSVARRVVDRHVLHLLKMWLKTPIEEQNERGGRRMTGGKRSTRGTPQGGVISPLLANIYMHRFLRAWRERGKGAQYQARLINYADDFVILSRGHAAEALAWTRWAMTHLGLTLNETKTCLRHVQHESFDFLGYTFGWDRYRKDGHAYLAAKPSKKGIQRVKAAVRAVLRPGNQGAWPEVVARLNRTLRGWATYFSYGTRLMAYRAIDNYVYACARHFLRRRHKVPTRGTRTFPAEQVFGPLGVVRLRPLHVGPRSCTSA